MARFQIYWLGNCYPGRFVERRGNLRSTGLEYVLNVPYGWPVHLLRRSIKAHGFFKPLAMSSTDPMGFIRIIEWRLFS